MSVEILDPDMGPGRRFVPNSWAQRQVVLTEAPDVLYSGGIGASKSRTLCEKADLYCRREGRCKFVLARKRRVDLGATTLPILLEQVITPSHRAWGWRPSADGGSTLYYPNGARIFAFGLDDPAKLLSGEYSQMAVDQAEQLEESEWNAGSGRLRWKHGGPLQMIAACNPADPAHFLYRIFRPDLGSHRIWATEDRALPNGRMIARGTLEADCILSQPGDNYENLPAAYLARMARYSGKWYERFILGKWITFEGAVFEAWDANLHCVSKPAEWSAWHGLPPPDWKRYCGIDLGFDDPFVCQWFAVSPDQRWYRYRELYVSHRTVDELARQILDLERREMSALRHAAAEQKRTDLDDYLAGETVRIAMRACDHDRGEREILRREGVHTVPAKKDIRAGIQTMVEMLAGEAPRLLFVRGASVERDARLEDAHMPTCFEDEAPRYRWDRRLGGQLEGVPKDLPVDKDNHAIDAVRYAVYTALSRNRSAIY